MARTPSLDAKTAEKILGNPADFIITSENRATVRKWAVAKGMPSTEVYKLSNVELANLYHASGSQSNIDEQTRAADMLVKAIQAIGIPSPSSVDAEAVREICREEIAAIAPTIKKIEITNPRETVTIDGTVHHMTEIVIKIAAIGHAIMLVGPAGCGKTTIGEHVSKALSLPFYITSTVIDTHELMGFVDGYGKYHRTPFREAFENGGVWVADEVDAWDAAALLAANSALANGFATFPDASSPVKRHADFRMIATANTFGHGADRVYVGRNELDAASLDRFATIAVDYDTTLEEIFSNGNPGWLKRVWEVRKLCLEKNIRHVVSSRAIILGSQALQIGIDRRDVEEIYLFKGMSKNDREKMK
jgi:cobaltochelatase CobS